ncbi:MAG: helix-turn-helix domain-containing protein [Pseudonocardia sp.]|nr:helix-turn-helix domain-containing protein [Pseudonocardia sp.]
MEDFAAQIGGVSALAEPARRALYLYVVSQERAVSRDEAAAGLNLPHHTVKFHLDKLVQEGLLDTESRRLFGRRGPGAGRPTKLYRRSAREVAVSLPPRHYDLAGEILAAALDDAARAGCPVRASVQRAAATAGRRIGSAGEADGVGGTALDAVTSALAAHGYEPRHDPEGVVLANCPFHALARDHTELVCGMNLHLIGALLDECGATSVRAVLDPQPGRCCVRLSE